ncbi:unnamed protein product [Spirodela intermedia]|uniref:Uncharacterized protein n=1 Tax=Spirodela intermedia TaxID=51605 RepID=A0A7I8KF53_SPIIN|nr:unnamed protein product [Spirodela intermedia]
MVARLTPDQKVACSIHVGFKTPDHPDLIFIILFLTTQHVMHAPTPSRRPPLHGVHQL